MFALLGDAWASINGEDVCPQCQTAAERVDLARRMISAIEAEIIRSAEQEPSPVESGLVTFAMQLREALESYRQSRSAQPSQDEPNEFSPHPGHTHLDVAITGAFLTGRPLRIGIDNYAEVQRELEDKLTEEAEQGWLARADELREGSYESGGGFSKEVPLILASRGGAKMLGRVMEILGDRTKRQHDWLERQAEGVRIWPTSMRIDVYDLGVAVINGTFDVHLPAQASLADVAKNLKRMVSLRPADERSAGDLQDPRDPDAAMRKVRSPITEMFRLLSVETNEQFGAGVDSTASIQQLKPWLPLLEPSQKTSADWGRLLWLHPVHLLETGDADHRSCARALAPTFHKAIAVPDGRFVSGIGWSAIVTGNRSARDLPLKLVQLHWAYFALYMEIDRGLLTVLDHRKTDTKGTLLAVLEEDARAVSNDYLRVMKARSRVDSALASLGGDEQAIWEVIADVQKFDALTDGVDRKVEVLQRIADRRVQQATAAHTRRSTRILGVLTTFTLVTLATTILAYFFGGFSDIHPEDHVPLRVGFLVGGLVSATIIWFWTFQPHPWRSWKAWRTARAESDGQR